MPRLSTFDYLGTHRYALTWCTFNRAPAFCSFDTVSAVLGHIRCAAGQHQIAVFAYCFMPDHLHLLVGGEAESSDAGKFVNLTKQRSGYAYRLATRGRLWQRSGWDRVLRADEDTMTVMRYLLANPVRAGFVAHPLEWAGSGSLVYEREVLLDAFRDDGPAG